jgi:hypothetical protein
MKIILLGFLIAIFTMEALPQDLIGAPFIIKKGETAKSGRLKIKYLGSLAERNYGFGTNGERFENYYNRYHFEVEDKGEVQSFKEISNFKINGLVVEIVEQIKDSDSLKIVVMTEQQFGKKVLDKVEIETAFTELSAIKTFAIGPTGYAAVISQGEKLLLKILRSERADAFLVMMLRDGTNEAKLYALYGLQKLDRTESKKHFENYRNLQTEVQTMSGCEIGKEKFSEVVVQIDAKTLRHYFRNFFCHNWAVNRLFNFEIR